MDIEELKLKETILSVRVEDYHGSDKARWEIIITQWWWNPITKVWNGQGSVLHPRFSKKARANSIAHSLKTFYELEGYTVLTAKQVQTLFTPKQVHTARKGK